MKPQKTSKGKLIQEKSRLRRDVVASIRAFFKKKRFIEVDVPLVSPYLIPESYLEVFKTEVFDRRKKNKNAYLTPSPELFMKRLLSEGVGNCFTLTKAFRNSETNSLFHNIEFTLLEWYRVKDDYKQVMLDTESLLGYVANRVLKMNMFEYKGKKISLAPPWERISMKDAFERYAYLDLESLFDKQTLIKKVEEKGYTVEPKNTWEELFNQLYLNEVEPHLGRNGYPTILYDFPIHVAALARKKKADPRFVERFEVFIEGIELGDAYSELTDVSEQRRRFEIEIDRRKQLAKSNHEVDTGLLSVLEKGLPKCAGMALGVDRLIMLLSNASSIQDVLLYPADSLWKF